MLLSKTGGYFFGLVLAGLNPLHLHPGKLHVCGSRVFSYMIPYIRT